MSSSSDQRLLLHQIFEQQAVATPMAIAVEHVECQERLTYKQLNCRANRLAAVLTKFGVNVGSIVAIYLPRGIEQYVAMLAILKAGGAYVPIDTELPADRLSYILKDSRASLCLTTKDLWRADFAVNCSPLFVDAFPPLKGEVWQRSRPNSHQLQLMKKTCVM